MKPLLFKLFIWGKAMRFLPLQGIITGMMMAGASTCTALKMALPIILLAKTN